MDTHDLNHSFMHATKYIGEMANICEKLEHDNERDEGIRLARIFLDRRIPHMEKSFQSFIENLRRAVEGQDSTKFDVQGAYL